MDFRLLGFAGLLESANLHPAVVHFPLALVPTSFVLFAAGHLADSPGVRLAGRVCLWLAVVSAMAAVLTGARAVNDMPPGAEARELLQAHHILALVATIATTALAAWSTAHVRHRPRAVRSFLAALALDCLLVLQAGDLGARLVYGHGAGVG